MRCRTFRPRLAVALPAEQPARTFGESKAEQRVKKRGEGGHAQHPAPGIRADAGQQRVGDESDQNAEDDVELKHAGQAPAVLGRRNFRNVKRSRDGGDADAQASNETRRDEEPNIGREARSYRADKVKDADPEQRGFAPEAVSGPAADQRADDGAVKSRSHGNPVQSGTESPKRLNGLFGAGDDDRVKTEKEPGEGGGERPEEDASDS